MSDVTCMLSVGSGAAPIDVILTPGALELLHQLSGSHATLEDHRSLLTTIAVGHTAAGTLVGKTVTVDAGDILQVVEHAGTSRPK